MTLPSMPAPTGSAASVRSWDTAWEHFLHFHGDPAADLADANESDASFVMGAVFAGTYAVLSGAPLHGPAVTTQLHRVRERAADVSNREREHGSAFELVSRGEFGRAASRWDEIAANGADFAAVRFAHDVYLHIGDAGGRLASSEAAVARWADQPGSSFVAGQYAFALEEVGRYDEAERVGRQALEADADDLWARHALAHVYESTGNNQAAFDLLEGSVERWSRQDLLATHIWWHLALRLLAAGRVKDVLAISDERLPHATTAFRLCDQTSLLWRLELAGHDVGNRWHDVADRWATIDERHSCGFLDVHAAVAFTRVPDHPGATVWFGGLADRPTGESENDRTFSDVVVPLVDAFRAFGAGDRHRFADVVDGLGPAATRIGGSVAQRDLITLTRQAAGATT